MREMIVLNLLENLEYAPGFSVPSFHGRIRGLFLCGVKQKCEETRGSRKLVYLGTFYAVP